MVTRYDDPVVLASIDNAERRRGIPSGLLRSVVVNGERSNSNQVSSAGARTPFQVIPATRNALLDKYGVDAYSGRLDDEAEAAALLIREGLDRNDDDPRAAVAEYHGGTNRANHGPVNKAYVGRVMGGWEGGKMEPEAVGEYDHIFEKYGVKAGTSTAAPSPTSATTRQSEQPSGQEPAPTGEYDHIFEKYGVKAGTSTAAPSPTPAPTTQQPQRQDPSFIENVVTTGKNIPQSGLKFAKDTYKGLKQIVTNPVDTAVGVAKGARSLGDYLGISDEETPANFQVVQDVKNAASDPVGTAQKLGAALRDDPVGTVAMLAPVLEGAGIIAGTGRVGNALSKAASYADTPSNLVMKPVELAGQAGLSSLNMLVPSQGRNYIRDIGGTNAAERASSMIQYDTKSSIPLYRRTVEDIVPEASAAQRNIVPSRQAVARNKSNDLALTRNIDRGVKASEDLKGGRLAETSDKYKKADAAVVDVANKDLYRGSKQFPDVYDESFNGKDGINTGRRYTGQEPVPSSFKGTPETDSVLAEYDVELGKAQLRLDKANQRLRAGGLTPEQQAVAKAELELQTNAVNNLEQGLAKRKQVLESSVSGQLNPDEIKRQAAIAKLSESQKKAAVESGSNRNALTSNKLRAEIDYNRARSADLEERLNDTSIDPTTRRVMETRKGVLEADTGVRSGTLTDTTSADKLGLNDTKSQVKQLSAADKAAKIQGYEEKSAVLGTNKDRLSNKIKVDTDRLNLMKAQIAEKRARLEGTPDTEKKAVLEAEIAGHQTKFDEIQNNINKTLDLPSIEDITKMKGNEINQHIESIKTRIYGERRVGGKVALDRSSDAFKALTKHVKDLEKWRDNAIPVFREAEKIFKKYSDQIDRSKVIEAFKRKLEPVLTGDSVNARSFADAYKNPQKIIDDVISEAFNNKNKDGTKRLDSIITPEDKKRLADVLEELNRRSEANRYANTTNQIDTGKTKIDGTIPMSTAARLGTTIIKSGYRALNKKSYDNYLNRAISDYQDPKAFKKQLDRALPRYKKVEKVKNALSATGGVLSTAAKKGNYFVREAGKDEPKRRN